MGEVNRNTCLRLASALARHRAQREQRTVRVPSNILYRVDRERRGELTRQEQWESVMQRLDPLLPNWELTEDQLQFVKDRIEEAFNLGRHPDTISQDELITMYAYAVDFVHS